MHIRSAKTSDVPNIAALIEQHALEGKLLPRSSESIKATLADWLVGEDADGELVACVSLLRYTPELAEVRSLAVADKVKGQGYGRTIVKALISEAQLAAGSNIVRADARGPLLLETGFSE